MNVALVKREKWDVQETFFQKIKVIYLFCG